MALIVLVFLLHVRSAFVAVVTVPVGILIALGVMRLLGINANIMSLGGIAIAIGVMVDARLVMVENAHKHIERARKRSGDGGRPPAASRRAHRRRAPPRRHRGGQGGRPVAVLLAPDRDGLVPAGVHAGAGRGRLFRPLALTKTFSMAAAAILAVTLVPALMAIFVKGRIRPRGPEPHRPVLHHAPTARSSGARSATRAPCSWSGSRCCS